MRTVEAAGVFEHHLLLTKQQVPVSVSSIRCFWWTASAMMLEGLLIVVIVGLPHRQGSLHGIVAPTIVFLAALGFLGRTRLKQNWAGTAVSRPRLSPSWAIAHALSVAFLIWWYVGAGIAHTWPPWLLSIAPLGGCALLTCSLVCISYKPHAFVRLLRGLNVTLVYAAGFALGTFYAVRVMDVLWYSHSYVTSQESSRLSLATLRGVQTLLQLARYATVADYSTAMLGTPRFQVTVGVTCSGLEGVAMIAIFTAGWLVYARKELRLARAVWLLPASIVLAWILNLFRIAALIAIGDAGHERVAVVGFHSQAGWILFNLVAIGFLLAANRLAWFQRVVHEPVPQEVSITGNDAAVYLLPFLAVVATALITAAFSAGFDWMYPCRLVTAAAALWYFRDQYSAMDWRCDWVGPLSGVGIGLLWIVLEHWHTAPATGFVLRDRLMALPPWQRVGWLSARVLAAVVTVPIVEELAFRGYLARRFTTSLPESLPLSQLTMPGILLSSVAFGAMHGGMWFAGTLAGLTFAMLVKVRGRLGDAVAAHASANLVLAVAVLFFHDYRLW